MNPEIALKTTNAWALPLVVLITGLWQPSHQHFLKASVGDSNVLLKLRATTAEVMPSDMQMMAKDQELHLLRTHAKTPSCYLISYSVSRTVIILLESNTVLGKFFCLV